MSPSLRDPGRSGETPVSWTLTPRRPGTQIEERSRPRPVPRTGTGVSVVSVRRGRLPNRCTRPLRADRDDGGTGPRGPGAKRPTLGGRPKEYRDPRVGPGSVTDRIPVTRTERGVGTGGSFDGTFVLSTIVVVEGDGPGPDRPGRPSESGPPLIPGTPCVPDRKTLVLTED